MLHRLDLSARPIDKPVPGPTNRKLRSTNRQLRLHGASGTASDMALIIAFLLGVGNFACHRAVIASGHRMLSEMPPGALKAAQRASLALEFILLCGALYAATHGAVHWVWLYAGYFLLNLGAAWSIVTRRL